MIPEQQLVIEEVNSVFEQPWWLNIVATGRWHEFSVTDKNGRLLGRLPYVERSLYGLDICGVPQLTQQMGPWFRLDNDMKPVAKLKRVKMVTEEFIKQLSSKRNVDLYFHGSYQYVLPFIWAGYRVEPKFSYVIEDLSDLDKVYSSMDSKVRNLIKNAARSFSLTEKIDFETLFYLLKETFAKQGREYPMNKALIANLCKQALNNSAGKLLGVCHNDSGKIIAAAFFVYDKKTCYYLLGGRDYKVPAIGVQEFLLWEGIKYASTKAKEFDFEGSMIPSIESFFRGFGGTPRTYYRVWRGNSIFCLLQWIKPKIKTLLHYK